MFVLNRFIGGRTIKEAVKNVSRTPYHPIFDYAKESARNDEEAFRYVRKMQEDVLAIPRGGSLALKASSFMFDYTLMDKFIKYTFKRSRVGVKTIYLDAEQDAYHDVERELYDKLLYKYNKDGVVRLYKTYQMYRKDSLEELKSDIKRYESSSGLGVKMVRGAYLNQDKKNAGVLWESKEETDASYNAGLAYVLECKTKKVPLLLATHNDYSIQKAMELSLRFDNKNIEYAQLLGMNDRASRMLHERGLVVHKYVPYGSLIETYPYLIRRVYENMDVLRHIRKM